MSRKKREKFVATLAAAGLVVYLVAKIYVAITPTPSDDQLPDKVMGVFLTAKE